MLAEEEILKVEFVQNIKNYGVITEEKLQDANKGQKSLLPVWLSTELFQRQIVNIAIPKYFSDQFKDTLLADPTVVSIKEKTPYFYELSEILFPIMVE